MRQRWHPVAENEQPRRRLRKWRRVALFVFGSALVLAGCSGPPAWWLYDRYGYATPEVVYGRYEPELHAYARRLEAGEVRRVEGRGYAIPPFLIDKGARLVVEKDGCFVVVFESLLDNPVPELWYSPTGFDPMPSDLSASLRDPRVDKQWLSPHWIACYSR
jgi:hypothetical protein